MPFGKNIVTDLPLCAGGADMYLQANELKIGMRATDADFYLAMREHFGLIQM